jgi:High potential iron-sulfur protein
MSTHDAQRRAMLRGVLAAGCALCVPTMWGCGRKERSHQEGAAPSGPARGSAAAATADTTGKVGKAQAKYQEQPKGDQKCSDCMHFIAASNTCKLVQGQISPNGWCILWAAAQK